VALWTSEQLAFVNEPFPVGLTVKVTDPPGYTTVPLASESATVAVHVVWFPISTGLVQLTLVVVERAFTVTVNALELLFACVPSFAV
jgi:hypothetical protein